MPIHTVAPDKPTYIRIVQNMVGARDLVGKVGVVSSLGENNVYGDKVITLVFAEIHGVGNTCVFDETHVEYITKKEYFVGALGGK